MAVKANSLTRLEAVVKSKRPVEADTLSGMEPFDCLIGQVDLTNTKPHELHKAIRVAQAARVEALDDEYALLGDDMINLTADEKNFVKVFTDDVRSGILRKNASETFERVDEILAEQAAKNED